MNIDYQTVVDQQGEPKSALINWADFQEILTRLKIAEEVVTEESSGGSEVEESSSITADVDKEYTENPIEYKQGGDYKPLAAIGVGLPKGLKRTVVPTDRPEIPKQEESKIKLGKRIR